MIGGILALLGGLIIIGLGAFVGIFTFGLGFLAIGGIGTWIVICSIIVIVAASQLKAHPFEHSKWGAIILVFSIIGGWSILDFIGGILALVYTPIPSGASQQYYGPPPSSRICPQCGTVVQENVRFCPHCGKQLY